MATFYFVRHGKTDYSERNKKIFQGFGVNLSPFSAEGVKEIETASKDKGQKDRLLSPLFTMGTTVMIPRFAGVGCPACAVRTFALTGRGNLPRVILPCFSDDICSVICSREIWAPFRRQSVKNHVFFACLNL